MRISLLLIAVLFFHGAIAQFDIPAPQVATGSFAITDTVYMDVAGNDTNAGTFNAPVKTFTVALSKLPYGTAGVNGGHAYGLIMLKPGTYYTPTGFQQYANTWKNGNTYRNVSVEGIGEVTIAGTADSMASNTLLLLSGSHIYMRNLRLRYTEAHGVLLSRTDPTLPPQTNILIDGVHVDSVKGFCMLFTRVDTMLVKNSSVLYGARPGSDTLVSPCQWPSGIKFLGCRYATIHHSEIAYTRGEGLNFHNSSYGLAYNNRLHDNGLNIYDDNSSHLIIRNNLVYNAPGIDKRYWRNCPSDTGARWSGKGIMLANEGACLLGNAPSFTGCRLQCILPDESFNTVDSVYVFNNLFQNISSAFSFWEGSTQINGVNCIRNVFIFNNTVAGILGDSSANGLGMVDVYFPSYNPLFNSYYATLSNVHIANNIFSYDTGLNVRLIPVRKVVNALHPGPVDVTLSNNLWIQAHSLLGSTDQVRNGLPFSVPFMQDSMVAVTPCDSNPLFIYEAAIPFGFVTDDYNYTLRRSPLSNVGAIERDSLCLLTTGIVAHSTTRQLRIFPNPFTSTVDVILSDDINNHSDTSWQLQIADVTGRIVRQQNIEGLHTTINLASLSPGVYLLRVAGKHASHNERIVKQ